MTAAPWAADRPLDEERARAAIASQFPDLAGYALEFLGSGWDNDAWAVGDWVFRFPRRRGVAEGLELEVAALELAAEALAPVGLGVPRIERRGEPCDAFPYPFTGARRLPGVGGDRLARPPSRDAARLLARALAALHGIPESRARTHGFRDDPEAPAGFRASFLRVRDAARALVPAELRAASQPWLAGDVEPPPAYGGPARLVHHDLSDEHVLLDPGTGRPLALIDFADVAFADPALDFVGPALWLGRRGLDEMLDAYAPADPALGARVRFLAPVCALHWLAEEHARFGQSSDRHLRWLRNALDLA